MGNDFKRPVGPAPDVKELEFISALYQSERKIRDDGSIKAIDIVHYLSSRYGIVTTEEEVVAHILKGLGGGDGEDECIDLSETVAILLIPFLLKATKEKNWVVAQQYEDDGAPIMPESPEIIQEVTTMILRDTLDASTTPTIDKDLVKNILQFYGEEDLAEEEDLIQEMVLAATGGDERNEFDAKSFGRALTEDVQKYRVENETKLTSNYFDVFQTELSPDVPTMPENDILDEGRATTRKNNIPAFDGNKTGEPDSAFADVSNDPSLRASMEGLGLGYSREVAAVPADGCPGDTSSSEESFSDEEVGGSPLRQEVGQSSRPVKKIDTAPHIDYAVDNYRSKFFTVLLWAFFAMSIVAYIPSDLGNSKDYLGCVQYQRKNGLAHETSSFGCKVGNHIILWLLKAVVLCLGGTSFIFLGSLGNNIYGYSMKTIALSFAAVLIVAVVPFSIFESLSDTPSDEEDVTYNRGLKNENAYYVTALVLGVCVALVQLLQFIGLFRSVEMSGQLRMFLTYGNRISESKLKKASAHKINALVKNARDLHGSMDAENCHGHDESFFERALLRFEKGGELRHELCGGIQWTWKSIFSGALFEKEGVWLSSRLLIGNVAQIIVTVLVPVVITSTVQYEVKWVSDPVTSTCLDPAFCRMLRIAGYTGSVVGCLSCIWLSSLSIPSTVATSLRFRSGLIGSLHDKNFVKYRKSPDSVSNLVGAMLWGALYSGLGVGLLIALLIYGIMSPELQEFFTNVIASFIGWLITFLMKLGLVLFTRHAFYANFGLLRTNPARANFASLLLECWNLALGAGSMFVRGIRFVAVSIFYIGRVDTPVYAPGVGEVGPIELDMLPTIFRRDIVIHEAHRHPFMETLGVMYMMKLRHGTSFANRAGSCWRLIFVFALMPWMRGYRVLTQESRLENQDASDSDSDSSACHGAFDNSCNRQNSTVFNCSTRNVRQAAENHRMRKQILKLQEAIEKARK